MVKRILMLVLVSLLAGCATKEPALRCPPAAGHPHMRALLANAMGYINPKHGLFDKGSGYPVEGWNQDPAKGLYLRSFTQLTAIGEWVELLATIAAGEADNPYVSRAEALRKLDRVVESLLADQADPTVSAKGLLGNFLGFEKDRRLGPLGEDVTRDRFVAAFGAEKAGRIWNALVEVRWLEPVRNGTAAKIRRKGAYGLNHFTGPLAPFADRATSETIMGLLDERVVKIIFGDNVNLTASVARSMGALLSPGVKGHPRAVALRGKMERFIAAQEAGYAYLFDPGTDTFRFGWNASTDEFVGWGDGQGGWVVGHQNYFINEFRGPFMFGVLRYGWPLNAVRNSGLTIKPYRMRDNRDLYTIASWHGSAFQALGLSLFMNELGVASWRRSLEHVVDIEIDFAERRGNPGFLSESYSGNDVEYTGDIGIPEMAVTGDQRITDAPSLYSLGVAYAIAPGKIEAFLAANWETIKGLFTEHGPWEGYNTSGRRPIKFQTSAHTLSLILGGLGTGEANMKRYLQWHGVEGKRAVFSRPGEAFDFLAERVPWIAWSPDGDQLEPRRDRQNFQIRGERVRRGGITIVVPGTEGTSLSNGSLKLRYRAGGAVTHAVIRFKRTPGLPIKPMAFANEIFLTLEGTIGRENTVEIPMPGTPGLENVSELVLTFGDARLARPVDLAITGLEFIPGGGP